MGDPANAILHTPWDCRWSRFARHTTPAQARGSLWECKHTGTRVPIDEADCASCPHWEYQAPAEGLVARAAACERAARRERAVRAIDSGLRVTLVILAAIFAGCGLIVLTTPLAVPFTMSMFVGAVVSLMLGIFGNFRSHADGTFRGFLPPRA
jgi:hypothetical protein